MNEIDMIKPLKDVKYPDRLRVRVWDIVEKRMLYNIEQQRSFCEYLNKEFYNERDKESLLFHSLMGHKVALKWVLDEGMRKTQNVNFS